MPYQINRTDGTLVTSLDDYTRDTQSTSVTLLGRGSVDYGELIAENFVHMLENFAGPTPPANPLPGQTWFHTFDAGPPVKAVNKVKFWDGTTWNNVGGAVSSVNPPENPQLGDLWYNQEDSQIYYWDGFKWKRVGSAYTGLPGGTDPATIPDDVPLPPPTDPNEGDSWWMLPERKLWCYDSSLAQLASFPPKVKRVDGSLVPNGWVLIGPQGIQDPNDPNGGSWTETGEETVIDPVTGQEVVVDMFMIILDGKLVGVWVPKLIQLKENKIKGFDFGSWVDPYNPDADNKILQPGLNMNHASLFIMNGQASDSERLNGINASQFLRSDENTGPTSQDNVLNLGSVEKHWKNFHSTYHFGLDNGPDTAADAVDVSEVAFFGMASKALLCDAAEKAKMFTEAKTLKTADTDDVLITFSDLFATEANEYVGTAKLTQAGKDAVKAIAQEVTNDTVGTLPSGSFVPLDKDSVPSNGVNQGNDGTRWGTIYATTFDGTATKAKFADLAERYEADAIYPPGTLVGIGGDKEITITNGAFDYSYFGVISTEPAHLMNNTEFLFEDGLLHPPVALAGRVPVRVIGKVKKGDRLILSETHGVAIAAQTNDPKFLNDFLVVGRALVDKETLEEGLVLAAVIAVK
jgi:hypothetical protein